MRIRLARERRLMRQEDVAAALGVDKRTVGNWERGRTHPRNRLGALVALLDLDMTDTELAVADIRKSRHLTTEEQDDLIARLEERRGGGGGDAGHEGQRAQR